MRFTSLCTFALAGLVGAWYAAAPVSALHDARHQDATHHQEGAHHHPEAAALKNPVAADATSVAAGKKAFEEHCTDCHGDAGKGDGPAAQYTDPKPPDLTDAEWKHGSSDGEIFTVIHDGVHDTDMKAFSKKLNEHQIWDVVNYIRSLGPKASGKR